MCSVWFFLVIVRIKYINVYASILQTEVLDN